MNNSNFTVDTDTCSNSILNTCTIMKTLHNGKIDIYAPRCYFMSNNSCQAYYCTKIDAFSCICNNSFLKFAFLIFVYRFVHTTIIKYFAHIAAGLLITARG